MFEELKSILTDELNVDPALVVPEAEFVNDLKLNSLEIADFVVMCEDKFGASIEEEDIHKIPLSTFDQDHGLTRDTWLIGYESSFELRQVSAFTEVVKNRARCLYDYKDPIK
mgnify:CR=1 FL=1